MRKKSVLVGLAALGLVVCGAGTAGAAGDKDDKDEELKGLADATCVVLANGHNAVQKEKAEKEGVILELAKSIRTTGEEGECQFFDIDKYTIGVKTDGDVKVPEALGRIKGHATGSGPLTNATCAVLGGILDGLSTLAGEQHVNGDFGAASTTLAAAEEVSQIGTNGGCEFTGTIQYPQ
jgi:hypothetical protein